MHLLSVSTVTDPYASADLLASGKKRLNEIPPVHYDYEYLDDSDLEDEGSEEVDPLTDKVCDEISDLESVLSTFDFPDSPQPTVPAVAESSEEPSPPSIISDSTMVAEVDSRETLLSAREVTYVPFGATKT